MPIPRTPAAAGADAYRAEISRRLAGLIRAPAQLIPYVRGANPVAATVWRGQWTEAEKSAAAYYESLGFEVVRLAHDTSTSVGQHYEGSVPGAVQLADAMRRILPAAMIRTWTSISPLLEKANGLNEVDPRYYPVSGYPPDFLCARLGQWKFVEVKGPNDSIHFNQANWLVHLREMAWFFEVCMPVRKLDKPVYVDDEIGPGRTFASAYRAQLQEVGDTLVWRKVNSLMGMELVSAENQNAAALVRFQRRLWAGLLAKGFDPSPLSTLRSGRTMRVLDPDWPPEITVADRERMARTTAKQIENIKRIDAHNHKAKS